MIRDLVRRGVWNLGPRVGHAVETVTMTGPGDQGLLMIESNVKGNNFSGIYIYIYILLKLWP